MSLIHSSWAFSWSWHRSEAVEIMAGRFRSSFVIVVVAGIEAAIIWALGGWMIFGNLPGWGELTVVGAATFLIVAVIMGATEARHWRTAAWRSWQTTQNWRGGAYVSPSTRRHGPMLMCVHAVPRNQGHGSHILTQVCQWADQQGLTLELKPSGSAAERFYARFGFVKASRRVMGASVCLVGRIHKKMSNALDVSSNTVDNLSRLFDIWRRGNMPSYRTTLDGKDYRLVITFTDEDATCVIERTQERTWIPVQTWSIGVTARTRAPERRLKITESAADHGWQVPADAWGPIRHSRIIVETIHPAGWVSVVAEATRQREEALAQLGAIDLAWRDVLADAASIGCLPATAIAEAAGVSRGRVYQLREEQRERMNALDAGRSLTQRKRKP